MRTRGPAFILVAVLLAAGMVGRLDAQSNEAVIHLDSLKQVIRGFGAAHIRPWRPDMTSDNIQKAFGTGNGELGFSILRLRLPSAADEFPLNVATAKAASDKGVSIIASPWSPPAGMKTNNNIVGGRLPDTSYGAYAAHLRSFVSYMSTNDVPIHAVSVQNEPDVTVTYESCDWNASEMLSFVREYGDSVGTRLIAPESFKFNKTLSDPILMDSAATANIDIVGGHIYGGGLATYPLAASKGKEVWMTEHLELDTSWSAVLGTAREIHDCLQAGMNAYLWWYLVRYYGPIHEDGHVTKRGYVMSQFSRFIRPGFRRVLTLDQAESVSLSAYKDGSSLVIVAVNAGATVSQKIQLEGVPLLTGSGVYTSVTPYVTTATRNCSQGETTVETVNSFTVNLDSSSVTTLVCDIVTGVSEEPSDVPRSVELNQNYPNPFNPSTVIHFALPSASHVSLSIFDVLGREVATLVRGDRPAGRHTAEWRPGDIASGMYLYRLAVSALDVPDRMLFETRRMLYIR